MAEIDRLIGVQIGLVEDTMPNITFQLFRGAALLEKILERSRRMRGRRR